MDMESVEIKRSALIATVKQPCIDWLHAADPTSQPIGLSDVNHEPTVYLVPGFESKEDFVEWLEQHCEMIFEEQLSGWWTDERYGNGPNPKSGLPPICPRGSRPSTLRRWPCEAVPIREGRRGVARRRRGGQASKLRRCRPEQGGEPR